MSWFLVYQMLGLFNLFSYYAILYNITFTKNIKLFYLFFFFLQKKVFEKRRKDIFKIKNIVLK